LEQNARAERDIAGENGDAHSGNKETVGRGGEIWRHSAAATQKRIPISKNRRIAGLIKIINGAKRRRGAHAERKPANRQRKRSPPRRRAGAMFRTRRAKAKGAKKSDKKHDIMRQKMIQVLRQSRQTPV
jgi:hypothetical protein